MKNNSLPDAKKGTVGNNTTHNHLFERMNRPASQYQSTQVDWNKITQVLHQ